MIRLIFIMFWAGCCTTGIGQITQWQQAVKYDIDISLNDKAHSIAGNLKLIYQNNSPDTLQYIWFQLWPNAFKNDQTAFSEQQLKLGKTDFYFAKPDDRGYINQLDFRAGNISLEMEDHPNYIDLVKVNLASPLLPGTDVTITTPFHVKLPRNFGSLGHSGEDGQSYQLANWYPKVAVYDNAGWRLNPWLEQGRDYTERGSYNVKITLPANYLVAATGELQNAAELEWLYTRNKQPEKQSIKQSSNKKTFGKPAQRFLPVQSDSRNKTLHFIEPGANDFVLFADKNYWVDTGSLALPSGKKIQLWRFMRPGSDAKVKGMSVENWSRSIQFNSSILGDFPFAQLSFVESENDVSKVFPGVIVTGRSQIQTDIAAHRLVSNAWFDPGASSTPWFLDGLNTWLAYYYDYKTDVKSDPDYFSHFNNHIRLNEMRREQQRAEMQKSDQPINTKADSLSVNNYELVEYKTADWIRMIELYSGRDTFLKTLREYYEHSKNNRVDVSDFSALISKYSNTGIDSLLTIPQQTGPLERLSNKGPVKPVFLFGSYPSTTERRIFITPVPGYNMADGVMIGAGIHNYGLKYNRFRMFISPLFAFRSKQVNGLADLAYTYHSSDRKHSFRLGSGFAKFSTLTGIDSNGNRISAGFIKFTPSVKINFHSTDPLSSIEKFIEWKTFVIGESDFTYRQKQSDQEFYPQKTVMQYRYINQLTFSISDPRVLYPYNGSLQLQQANDFYRINFDAGYFFNYAGGGGADIRMFAAKFGYLGENTASAKFATLRFQPKLTAVRGDEDYTYSNYFIGRQEADGFASQQIMMRDGALKIRTDIFQDLQGRSDEWVASMNFSTTIPSSILPPVIPIRLFFDIGTYAGAWKETAAGSRFLYVGGLQLSLFHKLLNVYAPIIYSKTFSDVLRTVPEENKFFRKISFSIDLHTLHAGRIMKKYHTVY